MIKNILKYITGTLALLPLSAMAYTVDVTRVLCDTLVTGGWELFSYQEIPATQANPVCTANDFLPDSLWREQEVSQSYSTAKIAPTAFADGITWECQSTPYQRYSITAVCTADDQVTRTVIYGRAISQTQPSAITQSMFNLLTNVNSVSELTQAIQIAADVVSVVGEVVTVNFTWKGQTYSINGTILTQLRDFETVLKGMQADNTTDEKIYLGILRNKLYIEGWESISAVESAMEKAQTIVFAMGTGIAKATIGYEMYVGRQQAEYEVYQANYDGYPVSSDEYCGGLVSAVSRSANTSDCNAAMISAVGGLTHLRSVDGNPYQMTKLDGSMDCTAYHSMMCASQSR